MTQARALRIAVFHCGFVYTGGGERIVMEEVLGLRRLGHRVDCYAPTLDSQRCYPDLIGQVGIRTLLPQPPRWVPLRDALSMVASSLAAPLLAWRFRGYDAFVGANQPGAWIAYCVARVLGKPYVVYLNQPNRLIYPRPIDVQTGWQTKRDYAVLNVIIQRIKSFVGWADRVSFTAAETMLANGDYIAGLIERIYGRRPIVCPAGCHPQAAQELVGLNPHSSYRGRFTINGQTVSKPFVLITNRHDPQKRFEYVIQAMVDVLKQVPEACLVIPGAETPHTPKLKALRDELGLRDKVLFLGVISEGELQRLYREAALYCYPAPEEDFGMGVIEAMAWGVPVVAWNRAGPTVTVVDGETGYLAQPYDVADYAQRMVQVLRDPLRRAAMGQAAHRRVRESFTWERHVTILLSALEQAMGERQPSSLAASQRARDGARAEVALAPAEQGLAPQELWLERAEEPASEGRRRLARLG